MQTQQQSNADRAHSMMQALQEFRRRQERESSEFAAEFRRLDSTPRDCLALLESDSLTPAISGCSAILQDKQTRLVWLQTLANGRIAACFCGTQENLERSLRRGQEAAAAADNTTQTVLLPRLTDELRQHLLAWPHTYIPTDTTRRRLSAGTHTAPDYPLPDSIPRTIPESIPPTIADTAPLLEMTDDELRRMAITLAPHLGRAGLNAMRKEELVDLCRHLQHTTGHSPHI